MLWMAHDSRIIIQTPELNRDESHREKKETGRETLFMQQWLATKSAAKLCRCQINGRGAITLAPHTQYSAHKAIGRP